MTSPLELIRVRQYHATLFAPTRLRLLVERTHPDAHEGELAREARPRTWQEVMRDPRVLAVLNGPWAGWGLEGRPPHGDYRLARSMRLEAAYRDTYAGLDVPSLEPDHRSLGAPGKRGGMTIRVNASGFAAAVLGWNPGDAPVAVQGTKALVWTGVCTGLDVGNWNDDTERAALALHYDGRLMFAGGKGTAKDFALALREMGAEFAMYLDGGGSYRQAWRDPETGAIASHEAGPPDRPTPSHLAAVLLEGETLGGACG